MSQDLDSLYEELDEQLGTGTLSFCKEPRERSRTSEHIKSWRNAPFALNMEGEATNGVVSSETEGKEETAYRKYPRGHRMMQIVSAEIITPENEKKYVAYTIKVRKNEFDENPAFIQRRYTDFLELYNNLRRAEPALMSDATFPKKVLVGNFGPDVIDDRQFGFEHFLAYITGRDKLYQSSYFADFLQGAEQREAKTWISTKRYDQAIPLLDNSFRILNKFFTDRHPFVIMALCRLVACCAADTNGEAKQGGCAERYAELALRRFEGVSDSDLLRFYVPLLQLCVHLWWALGKDKQALSDELESLKRRGIKVDGCDSLFEAVFKL